MKDVGQIRKDSVVEIREEVNSKTSKAEGKIGEQAYIHGVKEKDKEEIVQKIPKLGYKLLAIILVMGSRAFKSAS